MFELRLVPYLALSRPRGEGVSDHTERERPQNRERFVERFALRKKEISLTRERFVCIKREITLERNIWGEIEEIACGEREIKWIERSTIDFKLGVATISRWSPMLILLQARSPYL